MFIARRVAVCVRPGDRPRSIGVDDAVDLQYGPCSSTSTAALYHEYIPCQRAACSRQSVRPSSRVADPGLALGKVSRGFSGGSSAPRVPR